MLGNSPHCVVLGLCILRWSSAPRFRNALNQLDSRAANPNSIPMRDLQCFWGVTRLARINAGYRRALGWKEKSL